MSHPRLERRSGPWLAVALLNASVVALCGQSVSTQKPAPLPEFEVASLKPSNPDVFDIASHVPNLDVAPGHTLKIVNITLKDIMMLAYHCGAAQISGPSWLINRFDIVAKVPDDAKKEQIPLMLQSLLANRFKLALHTEKRDIPVYALVVSSRGQKLQPASSEQVGNAGCSRYHPDSERTKRTGATVAANCRSISSAGLTQALQSLAPNYFDRPVVDDTGLTGIYDFTLEWISFGESMSGSTGPTMFTAIQQLGLNLDKRRQPMDIFVIDHCDKEPAAN